MKLWWLLTLLVVLAGCSQKPKSKNVEASPEENTSYSKATADVSNTQADVSLADLDQLLYRLYGSGEGASWGLYGALKACERRLSSRRLGGSGVLTWSEPKQDVKAFETQLESLGIEGKEHRLALYQSVLKAQELRLEKKLDACKKETSLRDMDRRQSSKVMINKVDKMALDRHEVNTFICGHVQEGASFVKLLEELLKKGWLDFASLRPQENLLSDRMEDASGSEKKNAFTYVSGWVLSYDQDEILTVEALSGARDAQLKSWLYRGDGFTQSSQCLSEGAGKWTSARADH